MMLGLQKVRFQYNTFLICLVRVRRDKILEDTLTELAYLSSEDLRAWNFTIIFDKEAGIDAGFPNISSHS